MDETIESSDPRAGSQIEVAPEGAIGKYELLRRLGMGGMGVVWAAHDPDLDREIAIKVLRAANATHEQRTRFLREARAMARLKHPNVLTVYEVDSAGEQDFIAMELVDGASLDGWLRERPPARDIWDALFAAGRGLAAAHEAGLVHRDFKPQNVLRSRDGRVMVTDFGLARGRDDADALASTVDPGTGDSVLDVRLTTTGQLLGTPAFMAPEQFAGVTPDPRTDQFAFCVTAWEALTGERPFRGTTIDALRTETERGVTAIAPGAGKLSSAVRGVLVRGLSPDRADRWPDVPALLKALARARRARVRRLAIALPVVAAAVAATAVVATHHASGPAPCAPGEQVFATAWSPAVRADLLAHQPDAAAVAKAFDDYGTRWLAGYAHACTRPAPQRASAVDCYLSARDDIAVQVEIALRVDPAALGDLEPTGVLAGRDMCAADAPVFSPRIPDDGRRTKLITLLARAYGAAATAPSDLLGEQNALREQAKALAWPPLAARIDEAAARAAELYGEPDVAHVAYREAADLAHSVGDAPQEARARIGVLETGRDDIVDEMPANAYEDELRDAELAVKSAGNDPAQVAALDAIRADHAGYAEIDISGAIERLQKAYTTLRDLHDLRRSPAVARTMSDYLTMRGGPGDLARAAAIVADVTDAAAHSPFRTNLMDRAMRKPRAWIAWLQGDLTSAHAALDVPGFPVSPGGALRKGHVVDEAGRPVPGARVVAWSEELSGDATRVYTDVSASPFEIATADDHGAFAIKAHDGGALIAELGALRATPTPVRDDVVLTVHPTHALTGTIDARGNRVIGIEPFVQIDVTPTTRWLVSSAPAPDGTFTIAGIPPAREARLGAMGTARPRETGRRIDAGAATDHAVIRWPVGSTVDYAVKTQRGTAWMLRGQVTPKTRAEVEQLVRGAADVATVPILPVGWGNATLAGLGTYKVNERHVVVRDNTPGMVTLCVAAEGATDVRCRSRIIDEETTPTPRDGQYWYGSMGTDFDYHR